MIKDKYAGNGLSTLSLFSELLSWKDTPPLVKNPRSIQYPFRQTIQATRDGNRLSRQPRPELV